MMHLKVTNHEIANGQRTSEQFCPIALAIWNAGYTDITVANDSIEMRRRDGKWVSAYLPNEVQMFISLFDANDESNYCMLPIEFDVDLIEEVAA